MKNSKYKCSECGGTELQVKVWIDLNTDDYCSDVDDDVWCVDCEENVEIINCEDEIKLIDVVDTEVIETNDV